MEAEIIRWGWGELAATGGHCWGWQVVQCQRRPADSLPFEVESYVDMVGNLDERDAFVHPVVLTVEDHFPFDVT